MACPRAPTSTSSPACRQLSPRTMPRRRCSRSPPSSTRRRDSRDDKDGQSLPFSNPIRKGLTMPAKQKTLDDLFLHTLKDIYYAEKQILKALPKMAKGAQSDELKAAFQTQREQTQGQIERLEQVFELLGKPARGVPC